VKVTGVHLERVVLYEWGWENAEYGGCAFIEGALMEGSLYLLFTFNEKFIIILLL
jgi:hypothetical protein